MTTTRTSTIVLDPTDEREPIRRQLTKRPEHIEGTIALLDISKPRGDILLAQIDRRLRERYPKLEVRHYRKPTVTKPAPADLRQQILEECNFVIEALAD